MTDAGKLAELADDVGTLSRNTATTVHGLQEILAEAGVSKPRLRARLNRVYCAEATGYVAVYFRGGRTNKIRLLVGPKAPPEECIGEANTANDINSYVGGIVRAGEYWMVEAKHESTSFGCVYTPLF